MVACHDSGSDPQPQTQTPATPTITSIAPNNGLPGVTVVITGTNFIDGSLTRNKVSFVGVAADIKSASATQLSVGTQVTDLSKTAGVEIADADIMIGGNPDYFVDKIDDIAIYNRALSADEVTQLYTQTVTTH